MKKLAFLLLGLMALASITPQSSAQTTGATLALTPTSASYAVGTKFDLQVKLTSGSQESDHTELKLTYDPAVLTVFDAVPTEEGVQVQAGTIYKTIVSNAVDEAKGEIEFSQLSLDPADYFQSETAQTLVTVNFEAKAAGTSEVKIVYSGTEGDLEDSNVYNAESNEDMLSQVADTTITVTAVEPEVSAETDEAESPKLSKLTLASNKGELQADALDEATLTVTAADQNEAVMSGENVDLTTDCDGNLAETVLMTNVNGQASTTYVAGTAEKTCNVTATSRTDSTVTTSITLNQVAPTVTPEVSTETPLPIPGETPDITVVNEGPAESPLAPAEISDVGPADALLMALIASILSGLAYLKTKKVKA